MNYNANQKLVIQKDNEEIVIASNVRIADTFFTRLNGLMLQSSMPINSALVISPCNSVHTILMRFSIDILYVNKKNTITKVIRNLKPYRISGDGKAYKTIELPSDTLKNFSDEDLLGSNIKVINSIQEDKEQHR